MVALAKADLRGSNSNTLLGEVWGVLDPLFQAAIYLFLVTVIRGGSGGADAAQTATMIIVGRLPVQLSRAPRSRTAADRSSRARALMLNSSFPRALLPLAAIYKGSARVPAERRACTPSSTSSRSDRSAKAVFLLPLLFVLQTIMGLGIALLVATATVYVRDTVNVLNYVTRILIFVTPVIYPVSALQPDVAHNPLVQPAVPALRRLPDDHARRGADGGPSARDRVLGRVFPRRRLPGVRIS